MERRIEYGERSSIVRQSEFVCEKQNRASIIVPVYNQLESCLVVIDSLSKQDVSAEQYEVIIVDDGSTDGLEKIESEDLNQEYGINIRIIHKSNGGRASARNVGIKNAKNEIIIFCDGDRVPRYDFISKHISAHCKEDVVVIGASYDYFGRNEHIKALQWNYIDKLSRKPVYLKKVEMFYQKQVSNNLFNNRWMTLLIGNSSIKKSILEECGGFNIIFRDWGFEHFELGIRLVERGYRFRYLEEIRNYHIPHKRAANFYKEAILNNIVILEKMHPNIDYKNVLEILLGNKEL